MFFFTKKSLNLLLILFISLSFLGSIKKADADGPPPPPVNPVTIIPNPFDPYETTDPVNTTTLSYYLYSDTLLWLRIYDLGGVLKKTLEIPPNGYTVDQVYGIAGDHSIVWDGKDDGGTKVVYGTYPYHWDDIIFEKATANTGYQVYDVVVDPTTDPSSNNQVMWMTGLSLGFKLWKSTNSGNSWNDMTGLLTNSIGPHYGIAISNDGQRIFVIDNGSKSLHYSINGGNTWFNTSLWATPSNPYDIACSIDGSVLYGVDKGTKKVYRGTVSCPGVSCTISWNAGVRPLGNAAAPTGVAVDPNDPYNNTILVADNGAVSSAYRVYKSTNGGSTFTTVLSNTDPSNAPYQVSIDTNGYYWVSVLGYHAVYQIRPKPTFPDETVMYVGGAAGNGNYQFKSGSASLGIFITSFSGQPYLYVASYNHYMIKIYSYDNIESDNVFQNEPDDPIVTAQLDNTPPGKITDLTGSTAGSDSIRLTWTAPGDDDYEANTKAQTYDLRYSKTPITNNTEFNAATKVTGLSSPQKAPNSESFTITNLESNTKYYFAMKAKDEYNWSDLPVTPALPAKTGLLWEWNMVSCPKQPIPDDSNSVFGDDAGIDWMLDWVSTWTGAGNPDYTGDWVQVKTIAPGKGLLLLSYDTLNPTDAPPASTPIADASRTLHLRPGWNLIGNPYETSVNLSNCDVSYTSTEHYLNVDTLNCSSGCTPGNWIGNAVYIWNGSDYDFAMGNVAQLEPWKAYWILACCDLDLIIYKP